MENSYPMEITEETIMGYVEYGETPSRNLVLIKGINQGINRVSIGVSASMVDTLLTTWLTPEIKENVYNNKEIIALDFHFLDSLDEKEYSPSIESDEIDTHQIDTSKRNVSIGEENKVKIKNWITKKHTQYNNY